MTTPLFQQFRSLVIQADDSLQADTIANWDQLTDDIFAAIEINSKYFAIRFDQILDLWYQLLHGYQNEQASIIICSHLFEIFVATIQMHKSLIKKNQTRLINLIQKLLQLFNMLDFQTNQQWSNPIEGYNEGDDFNDQTNLTKQIMSYFDRIASHYQYQKFIQFFNTILPGWFNIQPADDQWKRKYTLLMATSQLGQDIGAPLMILNFIQCAISSANHPHPKVRFAVLQLIGQFSDDMKPTFQQAYGQKLLPIILNATNDSTPRVQSHSMACLTNFLQDYEQQNFHLIQPYIDQIIDISRNFLMNGNSLIKQNSISCLASLLSIDLLSNAQLDKIVNIIQITLSNDLHKQTLYNQLINQTIECLSLLLYGQGKAKVSQYLQQTIQIMKSSHMQQILTNAYFVNSWSRICLKYQNFTNLSDIFPIVIKRITQMIQLFQDQLQASILSIGHTITAFKSQIKPFAHQIISLCKNGIEKLNQQHKHKQSLYDTLQILITTLKSQAPDPQWQTMSKDLFDFFYQQVQNILNHQSQLNQDYPGLHGALKGLQKIISHLSYFFNQQTVTIFTQKLYNFCVKINQLIVVNRNNTLQFYQQQLNNGDEIDQQLAQKIVQDQKVILNELYQSRLVIPDIFLSILKVTSKQKKNQIVTSLYTHVSMYLQNNLPSEDIRYGLYYLCNFLDEIGYEGIQSVQQSYQQKFCQFGTNTDIFVRNSAIYGLGEFMKSKPIEKTTQQNIYKWLNILWNSLSISTTDNVNKKQFNFARDNIVSALGKLIQSKRNYFPHILTPQVHKKWFQNLPLNNDKTQGNIQQQILLKLINQDPSILLNTKQDILQLLTIFAKYFSKRIKKTNDQINKNKTDTKNLLVSMQSWPIFSTNMDYLWNNLQSNHKNILTQLMA